MPQNANANARADRALLIAGLVAVVSLQFGATILNEVGYKLQLQLGNLVIDNFITPLTRSSPAPPAPRPYVEMQPDEIRLLAPSAAPSEMRCGQAVQPESITSTRHVGLDGEAGVTVFVRSAYKTREENDGLYQFTYSIEVSNDGAHPVQLMSRHWVFTDENGHVEEVKGPGARGLMVKILPSTRLEYSSSTFLATPRGSMSAATGRGRTPDSQTPADLERRLTRSAEQSGDRHGSFQFEELREVDEEGDEIWPARPVAAFNAVVGRLALSRDGRAEHVPCVEASWERGRLPSTAVGLAHRLGAGAVASYEPRHSDPDKGEYTYSLSVTVSNAREEPVAVVGHEWTFTDEHGVQRHQKGAGLGGEHNVGKVRLDKQRALSYVARFKLPTRTGNVEGRLVVSLSQEDDALYYVPVNPMGLSVDGEPVPPIQPLTFLNTVQQPSVRELLLEEERQRAASAPAGSGHLNSGSGGGYFNPSPTES